MKNNDFFIKQLDEIMNEFNDIKARAIHKDFSGNISKEEITGDNIWQI